MVIRQRAIQAEDKQERHHAILDAAARLLAALAGPHREHGRRRRRGGARQGHGLPLFPQQGRAAARRARAQHRRVLPRADRARSRSADAGARSTTCSALSARAHRRAAAVPAARRALLRPHGAERSGAKPPSRSSSAWASASMKAGAGLERHFPHLAAGRRRRAAAAQLCADHRPVADVRRVRRARARMPDGDGTGDTGRPSTTRIPTSSTARCSRCGTARSAAVDVERGHEHASCSSSQRFASRVAACGDSRRRQRSRAARAARAGRASRRARRPRCSPAK